MQPCTPPRQFSRDVNGHDALAVPAVHRDYPKQFDGQLSLSAADARPDRSFRAVCRRSNLSSRSLALDHGSV
jgi:hypothetical protein